jgi:hypothetical protein
VKQRVAGTQVVIDLANSPSFEDKAVLEFFETSGRNLLPAEAAGKKAFARDSEHRTFQLGGVCETPFRLLRNA